MQLHFLIFDQGNQRASYSLQLVNRPHADLAILAVKFFFYYSLRALPNGCDVIQIRQAKWMLSGFPTGNSKFSICTF